MTDVTGNFIFYIFSLLASKFWMRNCLHLLFFLGDITSRNANRCLNYRLNKMQNKYEYYHSEF